MKRLLILAVFSTVALFAQNPATAAFPTAVATDTDLGVACNGAHSALTAGISASDSALPVSSGVVFCAPGYVQIENETIKICTISTNTLNVCTGGRAIHGTAASHALGQSVDGYIDSSYLNQTNAEVKAIETGLGANFANLALLNRANTFAGNISAPSGIFSSTVYAASLSNLNSASYAWIQPLSTGTVISRNIADAGPSLIVNQNHASSTGDILDLQAAGTTKVAVKQTGNVLVGTPTDDGVNKLQVNGGLAVSGTISGNGATKIANAYTHTVNFVWQDNYLALPTGTTYVQWGVLGNKATAITITSVSCSADTTDAVINLRRSDANDMVTSNHTCGQNAWSTPGTTFTSTYNQIATTQYVGLYEVTGTAKRIAVTVTYTTAY